MSAVRTLLAFLLVLGATVVAPGALAARWVADDVQDRDAFVDLVAPLAEDPDLRVRLADATAAAVIARVQAQLGVRVPTRVGDLARSAARGVTTGPQFAPFWKQAAADLHRQVLEVLDAEPGSSARRGDIVIDVGPLLSQTLLLLSEQGVPVVGATDAEVEVPVIARARIARAEPAYRDVDTLTTWVPVLWLGLVVLAVLVAVGLAGRLRAAGAGLLGLALGGLLVVLASGPAGDEVVARAELGQEELARLLVDRVVDSLGPYAGTRALLALVVGVLLVVAGAVAARRQRPAAVD